MNKKALANDGKHPQIHNFIALQKQYFNWFMTPEICKIHKSLKDLSVDAKITPTDLEQITQSEKYKEALSQLELCILRNNTFIRFNRCFDAVDRILQNENLKEGTLPHNFEEKNVLHEAGLDFYELVGEYTFNRDGVPELRSLLTLKALSAGRYLKSEDESEILKVRYIKALGALKNNELIVEENYESFLLDRKAIMDTIGGDRLYLPPKHQEMMNGGERIVDHLMFPILVYKKYLNTKNELDDGRTLSLKDFVPNIYRHNQLVWLSLFLEVN